MAKKKPSGGKKSGSKKHGRQKRKNACKGNAISLFVRDHISAQQYWQTTGQPLKPIHYQNLVITQK